MSSAATQFHVGLLPDRPACEVAELAAHAERLGFAGVWLADSQSVMRDAYVTLAAAASRTERIVLATGVTNPVTRHWAVIAGALATLDELSGGRALLGIGVGESSVRTLGREPATLGELERATAAIRSLLAGAEIELDGARTRLAWPVRPVPIWIASSGPRSLRLAAGVADGVLFQVGSHPQLVSWALARIDEGAVSGGRDPRGVGRLVRLACSVHEDREWARDQVRAYVAGAAGTVFWAVPQDELPPGLHSQIAIMKERYDYFEHTRSDATHSELVTDEIVDAIAIAGTPEEAVPRFRELIDLGVDGFVLPITTNDPVETMRVLAEDLMPQL
jgi:5,10-methylenetetrahydromethanopterin reductase